MTKAILTVALFFPFYAQANHYPAGTTFTCAEDYIQREFELTILSYDAGGDHFKNRGMITDTDLSTGDAKQFCCEFVNPDGKWGNVWIRTENTFDYGELITFRWIPIFDPDTGRNHNAAWYSVSIDNDGNGIASGYYHSSLRNLVCTVDP